MSGKEIVLTEDVLFIFYLVLVHITLSCTRVTRSGTRGTDFIKKIYVTLGGDMILIILPSLANNVLSEPRNSS